MKEIQNLYAEQQKTLQEIWIKAWCVVVNSENCSEKEIPTIWANLAVVDFMKNFGTEKEKLENPIFR